MSDLKPCPFCGGEARPFHDTMSDYERHWTWTIECPNCDAEAGHGSATKDEAAEAWNTRPASVPVEALKDIHTRWSENLLDDWEVCIEIKTLIDQAERREGGDGQA